MGNGTGFGLAMLSKRPLLIIVRGTITSKVRLGFNLGKATAPTSAPMLPPPASRGGRSPSSPDLP